MWSGHLGLWYRAWGLIGLLVLAHMASAAEHKLAIVNGVIIDGKGGTPLEQGTLLIRNGIIEKLGKTLEVPPGYRVIDAAGKAVMPGLADMHVHLSDGGNGFDFLGYQRRLNAFLYAGVTRVFDLGGVMPFMQQMHKAIEAGKIQGPYIHYVGPLIDSADPTWPVISRTMASRAQAPGIARYLKENGASAIKAYANLSRPEMFALVRAGRKVDLPVIVDAWVRNGAEHMMTMGMRAFAHTPGRVTDHTLQVMKNNQVFVISTLGIGEYLERAKQGDLGFLRHGLVDDTITPWAQEALEKFAATARQNTNGNIEFKPSQYYPHMLEMLGKVHQAGISVVAGTDDTGHFSGEELHRELEQLVEAGLTPLEAITTATYNGALLLKQQHKWGSLQPGLRADVLIVNGRPDRDISHTRRIHTVIQNGNVINRDGLKYNPVTDTGFRDISTEYANF